MTSKNENFGISELQFFIKECKSAGILDNNKIATLAIATKKWNADFVYAFLSIESSESTESNADNADSVDKELEESATSDFKPLKEKSGVVSPKSAESAQNANIAVDKGVKELPSGFNS